MPGGGASGWQSSPQTLWTQQHFPKVAIHSLPRSVMRRDLGCQNIHYGDLQWPQCAIDGPAHWLSKKMDDMSTPRSEAKTSGSPTGGGLHYRSETPPPECYQMLLINWVKPHDWPTRVWTCRRLGWNLILQLCCPVTWHHQCKTTLPISMIFWLLFFSFFLSFTIWRNGDTLYIFINVNGPASAQIGGSNRCGDVQCF